MRAKVEAADAVFPRALKTPPENEINLGRRFGRRRFVNGANPLRAIFAIAGAFRG